MVVEKIENLTKEIINIAESLDIESIYTEFAINEFGKLINPINIEIKTNGNPEEMTHKEFLSLEKFAIDNNVFCIDFQSIETEELKYYEGYSDEPLYRLYIEGYSKPIELEDYAYTIYLSIDYTEGEFNKEAEGCGENFNKKTISSQTALNKTLDELKEKNYKDTEKHKKSVVAEFNFKEIYNIIKDEELYTKVMMENTVIEDREISLIVKRDNIQIHFLHVGYNFAWNRLQRTNNHDLPISYAIIDKAWELDSTEGYQYRVIQEKQGYDPDYIYMLFADALDFSSMERYGRRGIKKLVINKGEAEYYKKQGPYYYLFNKEDKVIFVEEVKNVIDPRRVIIAINKLLSIIYNNEKGE